jgi:sugar lactone lactonase YvrE
LSGWRIIERPGRDLLGEGLYWSSRRNAVLWTDILGQRLNSLSLEDEAILGWDMPDTLGWVVERDRDDGFLAGLGDSIVALSLDPVRIEPICTPDSATAGLRMNDALVDAHGRLWTGTVLRSCDRPVGSLYRLDPDRGLACVDRGYVVTNGPAISPDGQWLYHADSPLGCVYRFALDRDGGIGDREVFLQFDAGWGVPDGMACDADGGLWVAHWGGGCVSRFEPDGRRGAVFALPTPQITNLVFAGAGLDRLFVTSAAVGIDDPLAGALFELSPGRRGLPTYRFGG